MMNNFDSPKTQAELELLEALFHADLSESAWNPATVESEQYITELEEEFALVDCLTDEDVTLKVQSLLTQVEDLWSVTTLQKSLTQKFADRVPQDLLQRLAQAAVHITQEVSRQSNSFASQLVDCVQEILPQWQEEDLQVLARPFAYAMRGNESDQVQSTLNTAQAVNWTELSEIEQARTGLAIARYALSQLEQKS